MPTLSEQLMGLYGRPDDPLWNSRVRPLIAEVTEMVKTFADSESQLHFAKLILAYPQLRELCLYAFSASPGQFPILTDPSSASLDIRSFDSPFFMTPATMQAMKPLVALLASRLHVNPAQLWPEGFLEGAPSNEDPCVSRLQARLSDLEPYAELEGLTLMGRSDSGSLYWPHYRRELLVFGGAQYYVGADGGLLCAPLVYSFDDIESAYLGGERVSWEAPTDLDEAPETWARNCGSAARAVISALEGNIEASAFGVLGHWEDGQFADGETLDTMLKYLNLPSAHPFSSNSLASVVSSLPLGGHVVVGIRWQGSDYGHWFNVRNTGAQPEWIDGQTGSSGSWPPPFLSRASSDILILKPSSKSARWNLV